MRIKFVAAISAMLALAVFSAPAMAGISSRKVKKAGKLEIVYIGTYTGVKSRGIHAFKMDPSTGALSLIGEYATPSPSYLAVHPSGKYLFACNEIDNFQGAKDGAVAGFLIDSATGALTLINQKSAHGDGTCHISITSNGKFALVANYGSGSIASLPIDTKTGELGDAVSAIQHSGKSVDSGRQEGPHAHSIITDSTHERALVCDLGLDKIMLYHLDAATGKMTPNEPAFGTAALGVGPRHIALHPTKKVAYVNNEMASSVTTYHYDIQTGSMSPLQSISTLPAPTPGNSTAEIQIAPNGKFVYVSNRGHNSIAVFKVAASGTLSNIGYIKTGGKTPRCFSIDPTGKWLIAANQDSDNVVVFKMLANGLAQSTDHQVKVGMPVCVVFHKL